MELNNFNIKIKEFIDKQELLDLGAKYNFNNEVKVYIASEGLFSKLDQLGLEIIADLCESINLQYYLPQKADFNSKDTQDFVITNKIITDGDNEQLKTCQFVLAHLKTPLDEGVAGEISRFKTMQEYEPNKYWGVIGWVDDIRFDTLPNINQLGTNNQVGYVNQYNIGEIENSLGCYETLDKCFEKMYKVYLQQRGEMN